jgi:hypothetical protein
MTARLRLPFDPARARDLAEGLRARAEAAGAPPAVAALPPRQRAAFDRLVDALNRLPRPLMVLGSLALLASALAAPAWFQGRMEALAQIPEGLWWLLGAVLSLHFGRSLQDHAQAFQREVVEAVTRAAPAPLPAGPAAPAPGRADPGPGPASESEAGPSSGPSSDLNPGPEIDPSAPGAAAPGLDAELALRSLESGPNAALDEWRATRARAPAAPPAAPRPAAGM